MWRLVKFDVFIDAFLFKITSYDYIDMDEDTFNLQMDSYLLAVCADFDRLFRSRVGLTFADRDLELRQFNWDFPTYEEQMKWRKHNRDYISLDEVINIISEGMVVKWMDGFLHSGDLLQYGNLLQTRDFTVFSPSSFISSLGAIYDNARTRYKNLINEFSYNHANLTTLHM